MAVQSLYHYRNKVKSRGHDVMKQPVYSFCSRWHRRARKVHSRSVPSLSSLPKVAIETVSMFVWLNTYRSRPREGRGGGGGGGGGGVGWNKAASFPHSSFLLVIGAVKLWPFHVRKVPQVPKHLCPATCRPDVVSAVFASLSAGHSLMRQAKHIAL